MAYYLVRFYSGSGDRPPEQLIREVVDHELRPKLQVGGGLTRYITFFADDGRVGSASVYEDKEAAQRGLQIAREWASDTGAMQGYRLSETLEGEIAAVIDADLQYKPSFGMARLQLPGGRVGSFSAYDSQERREQHTAAIKKARENPEMRRVLPNDPGTIPVRIITSTG
jgi:hypothetical protein